ncbi:MAG: MaoC family dehydratase [Acidobacteriota bacterium]|nr:MaoC family dehydratase [Acidobacteriota bacterium]
MLQERWFEDYVPGAVHDLGSVVVDEQEVVAFARQFDPQPFHLERERAEKSAFGGLVASGWHTACMVMRLMVDHYLSEVSSEGSPGIDELRWLRPVRPGDQLLARITILDARRSRSRPERGIVRSQIETWNQDGEVVMHLTFAMFIRCRNRQE